jgi:molybdopterin converting factor small subunit
MDAAKPDEAGPTIQVLLHAQLRYYNGGSEETTLPFVSGATVTDYVEQLAIPGYEWMGVIIDGTLSNDLSTVLERGTVLELIPAVSGG